MNQAVAALVSALGADCVKTGEGIPARNRQDGLQAPPTLPLAVVMPRTVEEVSTTLAICHAHGQAVTPQGGLTGLARAAHPDPGEVMLSLERMIGIDEIDPDAGTLTAHAGTTLSDVQQAADEAGFLCGIDLGARGSCTIGGNVATNAGGNQVLRYGMTRRNILGLEVVLADGTIVRSLNKMMKNNAGYDWTQMFIGSEGTLGVVTRVVVALQPKPAGIETALLALPSTAAAIALLRAAGRRLPGGLLAFEAMWTTFMEVAIEKIGLPAPFPEAHPLLVLLEATSDGTQAGRESFETFLGEQMAQGHVLDALVAQSLSDRARFWSYRESPYDYGRVMPQMVGFDISFPIGRMDEAIKIIDRDLRQRWGDVTAAFYGHLADSNLHLIATRPDLDDGTKLAMEMLVYDHVAAFGGSVSAEHGIGRSKRAYLPLSRSRTELHVMQLMKQALDPTGILSPGRIF